MACWKSRTNNFGNDTAKFVQDETPHLKKIEAFLEDCDGDFVAWAVSENGQLVEHGQISHLSEEDNWESAKRHAEAVICYGSKRFQEKELQRLAKHFAKEKA